MVTSFIFRVLILVFGYAYPAYECYKTIELNKQEIGQLRFWSQYWILFGLLRELGVFADILFSWLPFYYGAKLGAFLYLWHSRTKGATFVYETFLAPFIAEHESEIDQSLSEFRARAADWGLIAWQMAVIYLQTSVPEMKKYAISLMPTMNSIEEQQQAPPSSSAMPSVRRPAPSQQPRKEARFVSNPIKRQPQEQSTKEPTGDVASGSEPIEDSDRQGEEMPVEVVKRVTSNSLRKRAVIAATSPA
ncbi:putative HVA22-like protein g [Zingiber officinale]|uniref:HVA22-like protein n=1 Tax=Zingiber officinale TaxID=94328 RepID=A0A8J5GKY6_ZINOF|nr:putative HVA22-like protein g [Zingiber officinale]XP_042397573.1 putative HVA22-like protein g [Zingiber officinale]XP_042397574.1 putative HVA22-like protein g [Zingiber officinale]KAG6505754.1 hypothetical protein ZIOFF_038119 [Zingiber officinale]